MILSECKGRHFTSKGSPQVRVSLTAILTRGLPPLLPSKKGWPLKSRFVFSFPILRHYLAATFTLTIQGSGRTVSVSQGKAGLFPKEHPAQGSALNPQDLLLSNVRVGEDATKLGPRQ